MQNSILDNLYVEDIKVFGGAPIRDEHREGVLTVSNSSFLSNNGSGSVLYGSYNE